MSDLIGQIRDFYDADNARMAREAIVASQHSREDRCFYCMSESEFHRAMRGQERRTIHMDLPAEACPDYRAEDWEPQS